jgi:uncharacterized FlaG/YvyC family protein
MDINAVTPTIPTAAATAPAPETKPPQAVERNLQDTSAGPAKAAQAPRIAHTHAELAFDETLNRVVGRIVNEETGETIHEIPSEQLKALFAKMREQLGSLVDGTA